MCGTQLPRKFHYVCREHDIDSCILPLRGGVQCPSARWALPRSSYKETDRMDPSEVFMRHAAECEYMAKCSRDKKNREVWRRMSERWIRCAELVQQHPLPSASRDCTRTPHTLRFISTCASRP